MNSDNKLSPTDMYKNEQGIIDWKSVQEHFLTPKPAVFEGLPMKRTVVAVAMGSNFLLVSARDPNQFQAKLYTSGHNNYGQLGHGNKCVKDSFHKLKLVEALAHEHIAQVAGGVHFAIALSHDGKRLYSWGRADSGQLGRGAFQTAEFDGVPKRVRFPERYVDPKTNCIFLTEITVGDTHALAVDDKRQLYSWGFNECGQTGHDASKNENDVFFPRMLDLVSHLEQDGVTAKVDVHAICASSANSFVACRRYKK
jgi:alpha-tubulin suppressor-like RCC1 family protein